MKKYLRFGERYFLGKHVH